MNRIEFIGTAGSGKTSIYQSLNFDQNVFGSREELILFSSRCILLEKSSLMNICRFLPREFFDWFLKKLASRDLVFESVLNGQNPMFSSRIYNFLTDDIDRKKGSPETLRIRSALLLASEKYNYPKIPVFDEGLVHCIKDIESHYFEIALDELLGVVHIDSDPVSLLSGLKKRLAAGNFKGARGLNVRSEQEMLGILESRLQHNRNKKAAILERGVPVITVNYHAAPETAKKKANNFLDSLHAAN